MKIRLSLQDTRDLAEHLQLILGHSQRQYDEVLPDLRKHHHDATDSAIYLTVQALRASIARREPPTPSSAMVVCATYQIATAELRECLGRIRDGTAGGTHFVMATMGASSIQQCLLQMTRLAKGKPVEEDFAPRIIAKAKSEQTRDAANIRHDKPGGSRENKREVRAEYRAGKALAKYSCKDDCADKLSVAWKIPWQTVRNYLKGKDV